MQSQIQRVSSSVFVVVGPDGATNFGIVRANDASDLLYTEVHPVTFFGNIPNWLTALKPLFQSHYKQLVPGHGPANVQEVKSGRKSAREVAAHMRSGAYASLGKTRMIERNINQFLTGRWY